MGLTSLFKRHGDAGPSVLPLGEPADAVQQARIRARRRLIGATLLVGIGIVGFPLVFETQPRPVPVDIPIEVPRKDNAPPLAMPPARPPIAQAPAPSTTTAGEPARPGAQADAGDVITETRDDAGRPVLQASQVAAPASAPMRASAKPASAALPTPPVATARKEPATDDGARARALLEGRLATAGTAATAGVSGVSGVAGVSGVQAAPSPAAGGMPGTTAEGARFVVQVGAYADAGAARDARLKVEQLGLKTYTQVASTAAGNRIRVRVGPFGTREEADKALARARGAGLAAVVLSL